MEPGLVVLWAEEGESWNCCSKEYWSYSRPASERPADYLKYCYYSRSTPTVWFICRVACAKAYPLFRRSCLLSWL